MKKQIWVSTLLYMLSTMLLFGLLYALLNSEIGLLVGFFLLFLLSLGFGYIFSSYILSQKFKIDESLLHLTKEILHELNIPLSTIQANSTLLKRTLKGNDKGLKRLGRIDNASKRLERLYMELIYSIKKEIHSVEKEQVKLVLLIEERVDILKQQKRNSFILEIEPFDIYVDKIGFEKMLDNILINAMKYSDKNSAIKIKLQESILLIEDSGVGMDEVELITIYERYYQSDYHVSGEGIGLALVKAYCDDEKIRIDISSQKGVGTVVRFDLLNVNINIED
ncbi:MAG: HAMP domain-containing histidine kinase [Sulfurovaceae bacterium]|nr:HAMP domain-containing histidine kinase [Sulfurovaceae bacterium]